MVTLGQEPCPQVAARFLVRPHKHRTETLQFDMMNVVQTHRKEQPALQEKRTFHPDLGRWGVFTQRREEGTPEEGATQPT